MASLLYLDHVFNLSDEALVERWSENVVWQYFSGQEYYEPRLPCDPTQIARLRQAIGEIGEAGVEELLKASITTAVQIKAEAHGIHAGDCGHYGAGEGHATGTASERAVRTVRRTNPTTKRRT